MKDRGTEGCKKLLKESFATNNIRIIRSPIMDGLEI
jgi:hypothetical protein